jgi:hypothetical protein
MELMGFNKITEVENKIKVLLQGLEDDPYLRKEGFKVKAIDFSRTTEGKYNFIDGVYIKMILTQGVK